jgi:transposase
MGKLIERCAGIDPGKRFLVCCVMTGATHEGETRRFDTTVPGLKRLRNWLNEERVSDVVMESTGSLDSSFQSTGGPCHGRAGNPGEVKNWKVDRGAGHPDPFLIYLDSHFHVSHSLCLPLLVKLPESNQVHRPRSEPAGENRRHEPLPSSA